MTQKPARQKRRQGQQELESSAARRRIFWDYVLDRLHDLGVAPEAHTRIVATLARKVPFPTREEYIASHRRAYKLLGREPCGSMIEPVQEAAVTPASQ